MEEILIDVMASRGSELHYFIVGAIDATCDTHKHTRTHNTVLQPSWILSRLLEWAGTRKVSIYWSKR